MMRRTITSAMTLTFITFVSLFIGTPFIHTVDAFKSQSIPAEVQSYIENEARPLFIEAVSKDPHGYGYSTAREVQNITIGEGFPVYLIDPQQLSLSTSNTFQDVIRPTEQWEFIVYSDQQAMSFLRVSKTSSGYQLESFGGDSSYVKSALQQLPAVGNNPYILVTDKSDKYIVKLGETQQELVAIASPNQDLQSFGVPNDEAIQSAPIIKALKQYQIQNEHSDRDGGSSAMGTRMIGTSDDTSSNQPIIRIVLISITIALFCTLLLWFGMKIRARR
ncbi:hypothetical protein NQ117_15975 [Paenibacillus sp. SC116]|uniref:hypothetical protein n=1 Tax=Paenibacillus sp. SC116 TaxID=2968986 RepID=UPI00215B14C9|nr:hypothetical protein [Paenibacillus sp. SC116]MCR8845182.1 hypothetical protein [Paenibacillus sp. SC116]